MITLSILIPSLHKRVGLLGSLLRDLNQQATDEVEILTNIDGGEVSTGNKRNQLVNAAKGKYTVFIDDDDVVSSDYIPSILEAAKQDADVIVFNGIMTTDDRNPKKWYISKDLPYKSEMRNGEEIYLRYPNHIVPIRRSIALQVPFPNKYREEDFDYATKLHTMGLIKTEAKIDKYLYTYKFMQNK
jgi:glycosyltransferase involved in cell wall biosynthesis